MPNDKKDWKKLEIGALWKRKSKTGTDFYTGFIKNSDGVKEEFIIFLNKRKDHPKHPDLLIYRDE